MADSDNGHGLIEALSNTEVLNLDNIGAFAAPEVAASVPVPETDVSGLVTLRMEDLVSDDRGAVVILDEAGLTDVALVAGSQPVENGIVDTHLTAAGMDVAGMAYYSFDSGMTLYLPADIHFSILDHS